MDVLSSLLDGFAIAIHPVNLVSCFIGVFIGTMIGVLPGVGPSATIAVLIPVTLGRDPVTAIIMLAGIFYGAQFGGSITSILVNIPGEASAVVTCFDGYPMARKGRAGKAICIAASSAFFGATIGILGLTLLSLPMSRLALKFGPAEYFAIMTVGLTILTFMSKGSMVKALIMAGFGLFLSFVGMDIFTGQARFTAGILELGGGVPLVSMVIGVFGVTEVLANYEDPEKRAVCDSNMGKILPTLKEFREAFPAAVRGTLIGFIMGVIPGAGHILSPFTSYGIEKRISKDPDAFGQGAIKGLAAPTASCETAAASSFIPLFTLGIPPNVTVAILMGALMIHGVRMGPTFIEENPDIFWGTISSMYVGAVMLLILNVPLVGIWVRLLKVPAKYLYPCILLFALIGSYSINNSIFDVYIMTAFGVFGYFARKFKWDIAPMVLAFVLGSMMERSLRQALLGSKGSIMVFFTSPIALICFLVAALLLVWPLFQRNKNTETKA
ncbi:MAG: tripartite tricarboxylate transporter permease [Syntrophaceae bacterium]|nr:tripartite tricarboxylate transporter permease [Syntrophaceae bacterium]